MDKAKRFKKRLRITHALAASIHGSYVIAMPYTMFMLSYNKEVDYMADW